MNERMVALTQSGTGTARVCPPFADTDDGPMFLGLPQMHELQIGQFTAAESSAKPAVMGRALPSSTGPAS
jgi:hypothetical protein